MESIDISPELMKKETSCITAKTLIKYAESKVKNFDINTFLKDIPYPLEYLLDTENWMLHEHIKTMYNNLIDMTNDPLATFHAGRSSYKLRSLGLWKTIGKTFVGPGAGYSNCEKLSRNSTRVFKMTPEEVINNKAIIKVKYLPGFEATKEGCNYTKGILVMGPTAWGLKEAELEESQCEADGALHCIYNISYEEKRTFSRKLWYFFGIDKKTALKEAREQLEDNYKTIELQRDELLDHKFHLEELVKSKTEELTKTNKELSETNEEKAKLITNLGRLVSPEIAKKIIAGELEKILSPYETEVTCLMSDLAGFTDTLKSLHPQDFQMVYNEYFENVMKIINKHEGTLIDSPGDGLCVIFGAPDKTTPENQAKRCFNAAIDMQKVMPNLGDTWSKKIYSMKKKPLQLRIGISTGYVTVGTVGVKEYITYRAVGDTINRAARLESKCEQGNLLIDHRTYSFIEDYKLEQDGFECQPFKEMALKGLPDKEMVYLAKPNKID